MTLGDQGTLFVGNRKGGKVYALYDKDGDYKVEKSLVIFQGNQPNGVAFKDGDLYIADISKIWKIENVEEVIQKAKKKTSNDEVHKELNPILLTDELPTEEWHGWKYIAFGPDGRLYAPVGAPCNTCIRNLTIFATILRQKEVGSWEFEIFAEGIRNTVGFDWHPDTKDLWFTDNGRDWYDWTFPPDELNHAPTKGLHFGYPYCYGNNRADDEIKNGSVSCDSYRPAAKELKPHVAALGTRFYTGNMFPESYKGNIFVAEHGSWNSIPPTGYKVVFFKLNGNTVETYEDFATGFISKEGKVHGRPVDILQMKDGSLLVSDDYGHKIFRITYEGK